MAYAVGLARVTQPTAEMGDMQSSLRRGWVKVLVATVLPECVRSEPARSVDQQPGRPILWQWPRQGSAVRHSTGAVVSAISMSA